MASTITPMLTVDETAELFKTTATALYVQRHKGIEPGALAIKVGRYLLWNPATLQAWISRQESADRNPVDQLASA